MSYPRIGNTLEVNGDFAIDFDPKRIYINGKNYYSISIKKGSLVFHNEYFEKLYSREKIEIYWSVFCSKTFYYSSHYGFEKVDIPTHELGGLIEINYYIIARENFTFEGVKGSVNEFFVGKYNIEKGCVLSVDDRKKIIKPNIIDLGAASSIIKFKIEKNLENEFSVQFETDSHIYVIIKSKKFVDRLNQLLKQKMTRAIIINSIFQSIFVEAIQMLADDDTEMEWKENLKLMINFDENNKENYKEFDYAFNEYVTHFSSKDNQMFLKQVVDDLDKLSN